jgi:uncharacterized protein (TIGR02246 family)
MRHSSCLAALIVVLPLGCSTKSSNDDFSASDRQATADSIRAILTSTYVFDGTNPVPRFMRLYADTGAVVSAASGGFTIGRDSIERALTSFWTTAGQYMQQPSWTWGPMQVEVLSREAAVVTARYTIPHWTPEGKPHVLGGAWTTIWSRREGRWMIVQEHLSDLPREVAARVEATMPSAPPRRP